MSAVPFSLALSTTMTCEKNPLGIGLNTRPMDSASFKAGSEVHIELGEALNSFWSVGYYVRYVVYVGPYMLSRPMILLVLSSVARQNINSS
jgi:hypothetical protein